MHCCFYFLAPHRTTPLDCEFLRRLQTKVVITPIVAKADTMTIGELEMQLRDIYNFLNQNAIPTFDYGETNIDMSWVSVPKIPKDTYQHIAKKLSASAAGDLGDGNVSDMDTVSSGDGDARAAPTLPQIRNVFAVISGDRHYIWGTASEEDPSHSDTLRLHKLLFRDGSLGRLQQHSDEIHNTWRLNRKHQRDEEEKRRAVVAKRTADFQNSVLLLFSLLCLILLVGTLLQNRA